MFFKGILYLAVLTYVLAVNKEEERENREVTSINSRSRRAEAPGIALVDPLPLSNENGYDIPSSANSHGAERLEASDEVLNEYKKQSKSDKLVPVTTYRPRLSATSYQSVLLPGRIQSQYGGIHENKSDSVFGINRSTARQITDQTKQGTLTHITIRHPIPRHRVIKQRMIKPRIANVRHEAQITDEKQQENSANVYSAETIQDSSNPRLSFNSKQQIEPLSRQHEPLHSEQKPKPTDRTSAFDIRFPIRQPSRNRQPKKPIDTSVINPQKSDQDTQNAKDSSHNLKPLTFHLGSRRRLRFPLPIRNKDRRNQRILQQNSKRTSFGAVNGRLNEKNYRQITIQEHLLDSEISVNSTDNVGKSIHKSNQSITSDPLLINPQITTKDATAKPSSILRTIGNVTLSLQRARELFSRVQERYKVLSQSDSNENSKNTTATIDIERREPEQQVSFSYSKIRHNDGSITEKAVPSISTELTTKESLETLTDVSLPSAEYHTTNLPITTLKLQLPESYESTEPSIIDRSSQDSSNNPESNINQIKNQSSVVNFATVNIKPKAEVIGVDYNLNSSSTSTELRDKSNLSNKDGITFVLPNTITKAEPILSDADNPGISFNPTIPPPVYKSSPFEATQLPALENLNLFGLGNSNPQQHSLFQTQERLKTLNPGSQTTNISNLFGLGSFYEFGRLSSNLGNIGSFGNGQNFGTLNTDTSQLSSGVGGLGYLGLLSGLSGLNLGQTNGSPSPEFSLPKLSQDGSSQHSRTGLGLFSGLSSLNLGGLGNFGDSGSLGTLGSIPGLHSLASGTRTTGSSLDGLGGFSLSQEGSASALQGGSEGTIVNFASPGRTLTELTPETSQVEAILSKLGNSQFLPSVIAGSGSLSPTSGEAALSAPTSSSTFS